MNLKYIFNSITSFFLLKNIFVVSLLILIFISGVSYKHTMDVTDSAELVRHSYEVRIELDQLVAYLVEAESGQRGFVISHDSVFIKSINAIRGKVNKSFNTLSILTSDNLQQQNNLDSLFKLINYRFDNLSTLVVTTSEVPSNEWHVKKRLLEGDHIMDNIKSQISEMINLEMVYLKERQRKYENEISFTPIFTLMLFLFSLIVFVISYFKISENLNTLKSANKKLTITTESFKHAEIIGNFSSWQWDLDTNVLIYSDNQYRLLGCEPQSFKPSIKKFIEFVHSSDIHLIIQGDEEVTNNKTASTSFFRIIRKDGELRYFKSIGKVLVDKTGKKTLIGINIDVTEQQLSNISLEERNQALEQTNKELASFNHVASHDLQEPLRKIQTFISRISEKDKTAMSETGQEYFAKILASVSRVRKLIDDLLMFSSTNKAEKKFDQIDLNVLLENVKQELAQVIEDKNPVIESTKLPVLNVIPFQIQQLFINLIGNSLKYSKPGIVPLISINYEKVLAKNVEFLKASIHKKYHKITFSDNGLGFEQEYADSIFILFHRLHHLADYPGTGIGLAICKKIVENHGGVIVAEGNPGVGALFTVFLPE